MQLFDVSTTSPPEIAGRELPKSVLYSISARLGGSGLDTDAYETVRGLHEAGILGKAIVYANQQQLTPSARIQSLRMASHPPSLCSGSPPLLRGQEALPRRDGARGVAQRPARPLPRLVRRVRAHPPRGETHGHPEHHRDPHVASQQGQTKAHHDKDRARARQRPLAATNAEQPAGNPPAGDGGVRPGNIDRRPVALRGGYLSRRGNLRAKSSSISRAAWTCTASPPPTSPPEKFRAIFLGALKKRKGVHTLLEAWNSLKLKQRRTRPRGSRPR